MSIDPVLLAELRVLIESVRDDFVLVREGLNELQDGLSKVKESVSRTGKLICLAREDLEANISLYEEEGGNNSVIDEVGVQLSQELDPIPMARNTVAKVNNNVTSTLVIQTPLIVSLSSLLLQEVKVPYSIFNSSAPIFRIAAALRDLTCSGLIHEHGYHRVDDKRPPCVTLFSGVVNLHGWPPPPQSFGSKIDIPLQLRFSTVICFSSSVAIINIGGRISMGQHDRSGVLGVDSSDDSVEMGYLMLLNSYTHQYATLLFGLSSWRVNYLGGFEKGSSIKICYKGVCLITTVAPCLHDGSAQTPSVPALPRIHAGYDTGNGRLHTTAVWDPFAYNDVQTNLFFKDIAVWSGLVIVRSTRIITVNTLLKVVEEHCGHNSSMTQILHCKYNFSRMLDRIQSAVKENYGLLFSLCYDSGAIQDIWGYTSLHFVIILPSGSWYYVWWFLSMYYTTSYVVWCMNKGTVALYQLVSSMHCPRRVTGSAKLHYIKAQILIIEMIFTQMRPWVMNVKGVGLITKIAPGSEGVSAQVLPVQGFSSINAGPVKKVLVWGKLRQFNQLFYGTVRISFGEAGHDCYTRVLSFKEDHTIIPRRNGVELDYQIEVKGGLSLHKPCNRSANDFYWSRIKVVLLAASSGVLMLHDIVFGKSSMVQSLQTPLHNSDIQFHILQFVVKVHSLLSMCFWTSYTKMRALVTSVGFSMCLAQYGCVIISFPNQIRLAKSYLYHASDSCFFAMPIILISLLVPAIFMIAVELLLARVEKLDMHYGTSLEGRHILPRPYSVIAWTLQIVHWSYYSGLNSVRKVFCYLFYVTTPLQQDFLHVVEYIRGFEAEVLHFTYLWSSTTQQNLGTIQQLISYLFDVTQMQSLQSFQISKHERLHFSASKVLYRATKECTQVVLVYNQGGNIVWAEFLILSLKYDLKDFFNAPSTLITMNNFEWSTWLSPTDTLFGCMLAMLCAQVNWSCVRSIALFLRVSNSGIQLGCQMLFIRVSQGLSQVVPQWTHIHNGCLIVSQSLTISNVRSLVTPTVLAASAQFCILAVTYIHVLLQASRLMIGSLFLQNKLAAFVLFRILSVDPVLVWMTLGTRPTCVLHRDTILWLIAWSPTAFENLLLILYFSGEKMWDIRDDLCNPKGHLQVSQTQDGGYHVTTPAIPICKMRSAEIPLSFPQHQQQQIQCAAQMILNEKVCSGLVHLRVSSLLWCFIKWPLDVAVLNSCAVNEHYVLAYWDFRISLHSGYTNKVVGACMTVSPVGSSEYRRDSASSSAQVYTTEPHITGTQTVRPPLDYGYGNVSAEVSSGNCVVLLVLISKVLVQ